MKRIHFLLLFCLWTTIGFAQTAEQAKTMLDNGEYEKAKPVLYKYATSQPNNANYTLWYGICCLKTGQLKDAISYLDKAVKKRATDGLLYLGQAYNDSYRFEEATTCFNKYMSASGKNKKPTAEIKKLIEKSKADLRMLKGVEDVCVIDSFVVEKSKFLNCYKISEESGKLLAYKDYFNYEGEHSGTVYETQLGNKIYYSDLNENRLSIFTRNKLIDEWSKEKELPESINKSGNTNYPFVMTDGVTVYFANDGEGLGGYDIFVTRYNTNTDSYMNPENVGMPFNSPFNDYMYAIDEFNNLGWFASDRYQPEGKVCIYVFIPNTTKKVYNYESIEPEKMIRLAKIQSLKDTWEDKQEVAKAKQRLMQIDQDKAKVERQVDFEFIIDDNHTYYQLTDFKSDKAKQLFNQYRLMQKELSQQEAKLENLRLEYLKADNSSKAKLTSSILDFENKVIQLSKNLNDYQINIRIAEKSKLK